MMLPFKRRAITHVKARIHPVHRPEYISRGTLDVVNRVAVSGRDQEVALIILLNGVDVLAVKVSSD